MTRLIMQVSLAGWLMFATAAWLVVRALHAVYVEVRRATLDWLARSDSRWAQARRERAEADRCGRIQVATRFQPRAYQHDPSPLRRGESAS